MVTGHQTVSERVSFLAFSPGNVFKTEISCIFSSSIFDPNNFLTILTADLCPQKALEFLKPNVQVLTSEGLGFITNMKDWTKLTVRIWSQKLNRMAC